MMTSFVIGFIVHAMSCYYWLCTAACLNEWFPPLAIACNSCLEHMTYTV